MDSAPLLVCFAVKEEAQFFLTERNSTDCRRLITGMGPANAAYLLRQTLEGFRPRLVVTSGFAGGLKPELPVGTVLFDADPEAGLEAALLGCGAIPARFHCAARVVVTAAEKRALRLATGADAVEMESSVIRTLCRERGIPGATVRVISDAASEDLPLDFNALMTPDLRISYPRLIAKLLGAPQTIPALMRFRRQTRLAAANLGRVLRQSLRTG